MTHIINGREWRFVEKIANGKSFSIWTANYFCSDGDSVKLEIFIDELVLFCFSGIGVSSINIDDLDFPYTLIKTNHTDPFEVQCLHIADYFCRLFCTWKEN